MIDKHEFILETLQQAGALALECREKFMNVESKGEDYRDIVTSVDLEVNEFIEDKIRSIFPNEVIYSEESGGDISDQAFWSIDPIDGTSNFARDIPHYAVVVSYIENREPVAGGIYNPVTKELFSFEVSMGAFLNDKPIRVNQPLTLKDSYVLLHIGRKDNVQEWGLNLQKAFLSKAKKNTNLGSSALDLAFLAAGRVDAVIYGTMTTVDVAVATALVRASGGEVYSIDGIPVTFSKEPQQIIATSNKALFEEISKL